MNIIRNGGGVPYSGTVVALGNFDGLHKAHMEIVYQCREYARENDLKCGVLLFKEHTQKTLKNKEVRVITQEKQKLRILKDADMDFVYLRDFDKEFMQLSPEMFIDKLISSLHIKAVCVGYDYRFGYMAKGDTSLLEELGKSRGFDVIIVDEIDHDGVTVKSTAIRHYIEAGSVKHAANMLGRHFAIEGRVVQGKQNGRKIGFPTANIEYGDDMLIPYQGVYTGYAYVDGKKYKCITNVGDNPTFDGDKITIESHILDFDEDIYDKTITIEFIRRIRGVRKFSSIDALIEQIRGDEQVARREL